MAQIIQFPLGNAEILVAEILRVNPRLAPHRAELLSAVELPKMTFALNLEGPLAPQQEQQLAGEVYRVASAYALEVLNVALSALVKRIIEN